MKWSETRVLVTGAAGFIGSHLIRRLMSLHAEVIALDNFSTGRKSNLSFFDGETAKLDVTDRLLSEKIKGEIDYIFHFGAPSSVILFNNDQMRCFNETCGGFLNIMKLASTKGVTKVVYPSSGSVYGSAPPPQSESTTPRPLNLYGLAKLTCEGTAQLFSNEVVNVGLRIFAGYGPHENHKEDIASPVTLFLRSIAGKKQPIVYGDGTQSRDFVYIDDIIEAIVRSIDRETPRIVNVGSGSSCTFNRLITLINEYLGTQAKPIYLPKPSSYLERTQAEITLLTGKMGIKPIKIEDGLRRYLETEKRCDF